MRQLLFFLHRFGQKRRFGLSKLGIQVLPVFIQKLVVPVDSVVQLALILLTEGFFFLSQFLAKGLLFHCSGGTRMRRINV